MYDELTVDDPRMRLGLRLGLLFQVPVEVLEECVSVVVAVVRPAVGEDPAADRPGGVGVGIFLDNDRYSDGKSKFSAISIPEEYRSMEVSDQLRCLFSARVEERDGSYIIEIPKQELRLGTIRDGDVYRVGMFTGLAGPETEPEPAGATQERGPPGPPVEEGEHREVEIEDIGEQGDGIARVERGFVVIVPETEKGERVTVEITDVRQNVAFAEVVERLSYYD